MSKHSHISAIFDNAFQSRAGSPDVFMSMTAVLTSGGSLTGASLSLYPMAAYNFCSSTASSSFVKPATVLERQSIN